MSWQKEIEELERGKARPLLCEWVETAYNVEKDHLGPKKRGMRC